MLPASLLRDERAPNRHATDGTSAIRAWVLARTDLRVLELFAIHRVHGTYCDTGWSELIAG